MILLMMKYIFDVKMGCKILDQQKHSYKGLILASIINSSCTLFVSTLFWKLIIQEPFALFIFLGWKRHSSLTHLSIVRIILSRDQIQQVYGLDLMIFYGPY